MVNANISAVAAQPCQVMGMRLKPIQRRNHGLLIGSEYSWRECLQWVESRHNNISRTLP